MAAMQEAHETLHLSASSVAYDQQLQASKISTPSRELSMLGAEVMTLTESKSPCLYQQTFATTNENGNLVGNIYYSNYTSWQAVVRDAYLFSIAPDAFNGSTGVELACLRYSVNHQAELMPYDRVRVSHCLK